MRPRKHDTGLPKRVYLRHGTYYYVKDKKWTRLGRNPEDIKQIYDSGWVAQPTGPELFASLRRFLHKKLIVLRARPYTRTGRLKRVSIDTAYVIELAESNRWRCAVTGLQMTLEVVNGSKPYAPSIDRIDNSKDYEPGNVRVVCVAANLAMNVWGERVLRAMVRGSRRESDENIGQTPSVVGSENEEPRQIRLSGRDYVLGQDSITPAEDPHGS